MPDITDDLLSLSKDVLLPLIHNLYHDYFSKSYGSDTGKWPLIASREFSNLITMDSDITEVAGISTAGLPESVVKNVFKGGLFGRHYNFEYRHLVVFRGSAGSYDWLQNLKATSEAWKYDQTARVHAGFLNVFKEVSGGVKTGLKGVDAPVIFTGHSLGGAVACLSAAAYGKQGDTLISFGSPVTGNERFNSLIVRKGITWIRVELQGDPIPQVPPDLSRINRNLAFEAGGTPVRIQPKSDYEKGMNRLKIHFPKAYLDSIKLRGRSL